MLIEDKLKDLGYEFPDSPAPLANYVTVRKSGKRIYTSGSGPIVNGIPSIQGRVGSEVTLEQAYEAARLTAVNLLSMVKSEIGDLSRIRVVKLLGFVNSSPDFFRQAEVINGASDLFVEVLGENGKHARSAIGTSVLPFNIPVEIEMVAEVIDK
ncbi:RidA family protein [Pseudalkalibacillus caeni]|uniref:RidA family protein n=1 Tax=Exobacillus caeni TaxID=2574798 RepID=A0A5R9EYY6_9BACL|nr:RidA family protein [Pseudalkalibacillus caeni]TLS36512.1 RidA family protein [Pseudalkalibacillus caeni]